MPKIEEFKLTEKQILSMTIPYGNNKVLIKTTEKNTEATTPSGILKISPTETDWNAADHASRWGEVITFPKRLKYDPYDGSSLAWDTDVDIYVGMCVWYDYLDSLNCPTYFDEYNSEYKLIEYANLYVGIIPVDVMNDIVNPLYHTKTDDEKHWVIPLNGYCLFEKINRPPLTMSDIYIPDKNDPSSGIAKFIGKPNHAYGGSYNDDIDLMLGDKCKFSYNYEVFLEHPTYATFNGGKVYKRFQRKTIEFIERGDSLIMPKNRVLVLEHPEKLITDYGLKLFKEHTTHSHGTVLQSTCDEIDEATEILFTKGSGRLMEKDNQKLRLINISNVLAKVIR